DEPILVSQLVRIACQSFAVEMVERALAQGEPPPDRLAALQRRLEELDGEPLVLYGLRGERAGLDRMLKYLQDVGPTGMAKNIPGLASKWKVFQAIAGSRQGG